ncbi:1763_t:CDS:2 [Ambispora leptoticha]|uniref:1763_t:CDS:1 n=1 Tax=Ambispora leptoticha TaxID=144679 RepID=A0A9N8V7A1_9GLOM|nr:1763_t:CDS:2 [Ambispora leptoticha]
MSMNDGLSILLAIFVIVLIFRWLLGATPPASNVNRRGNATQEQSRVRSRTVTPEMVETVCAMFPNIPPAAIQFDLQKTGSVEVTCDNILRDGGLPLPPPPIAPIAPTQSTTTNASTSASSSSSAINNNNIQTHQSLVHRYKLHEAVAKDIVPNEPPKQWEATSEKRHQLLQKRKEAMVLQARKYVHEQEMICFLSSTSTLNDLYLSRQTSENRIDSDQHQQLSPEARRQQLLQAAELRMGFDNAKKT